VKETPGAGLGRALSRVLGDAFVHAHGATVDATQNARVDATFRGVEHVEQEARPLSKAMFEHLQAQENLPPGIKALIDEIVDPEHPSGILATFAAWLGYAFAALPSLIAVEGQQVRNDLWFDNPTVPLSAPDAADAVERNILIPEVGAKWAQFNGVNSEVFDLLVALAGEPPPLDRMQALFQRGGMDYATLQQMYDFSRARSDWFSDWFNSYFTTMGGADAIEATVKGVIGGDEGNALFQAAGGLDTQWQTLLNTAGDAIGVEAAGTLYNHKLINEDDLAKVILHSRINPAFEPMAELLRHHWLGVFQISEALKAGACTNEQATEWLIQDGYPADQVAAFVAGASTTKSATAKALTESQVVELHEVGSLTTPEALLELESIGYNAQEGGWLLAIQDRKRKLQISQAAVATVRKDFLDYRVLATQASSALDALGVDPSIRDDYLKIWALEMQLNVKTLTVAEIGDLAKKGGLTAAEAKARWERMGYSVGDAELLLFNYISEPLTKAERRAISEQS
jgi:hypothetical protein